MLISKHTAWRWTVLDVNPQVNTVTIYLHFLVTLATLVNSRVATEELL